MNIKQALEYGIKLLKEKKIQEPIFKSKILLSTILNKNKEYLLVNEEEVLEENIITSFKIGLNKLCNNIPLQYVINKQEFMGLEFYVNENVLIPQPDTEILVEEVISICKNYDKKEISILDLCTGSGCIGLSIAKNINNSTVILSDISKKAIEIADKNYKSFIKNNTEFSKNKVEIIQSDLFENINQKFDIIVSNPPYIETKVIDTLDKEVQKEPIIALDGGEDGILFYRKIIKEAYNFLKYDGYLCLEIGYNQKEKVMQIIKENENYNNSYSKKDFSNNDRIIIVI